MVRDKRSIGIEHALRWAFGTEFAQLDLHDEPGGVRFGYGTEYALLQRAELGTEIDRTKGARSLPHPDADELASLVAKLPKSLGGFAMAARVAHLARMCTRPDVMAGEQPKVVPRAWKARNQHGAMAETQVLRRGVMHIEIPHWRNPSRTIRRRVKWSEEWCPVAWELHPDTIRSARRDYADWRRALGDIRDRVWTQGRLDTVEITETMPPLRPWLLGRPLGCDPSA